MRYLTQKQIEAMPWKQMKLYFLEAYKEDAERWQNESDDRKLFSITYEKLVEAINSLPDEPHLTVCVAMNQYIRAEKDMMDSIREHFKERQ